jgi:hypothetical protein
MSELLPYDLAGTLHEALRADRREPDGLLHCSGDLIGSLRHAQLTAAGAPRIDSQIASDIRLRTGTQWHSYFNEVLAKAGLTFMQEVKVTPWLPEGWSGTADWLFWNADLRAFALSDLKTIKGEGLKWVLEGAKEEHIWQLSAYYHALVNAKFPMVEGFAILYLPMNDTTDRSETIEPFVAECAPLPRDEVWERMEERWAWTRVYLERIIPNLKYSKFVPVAENYLNEHLAPPQERVQKLTWIKKDSKWELRLVPHWSADYCPFSTELCDCSEQGVTKIGEYDIEGVYKARAGYEELTPAVLPSVREINRKRKELQLV